MDFPDRPIQAIIFEIEVFTAMLLSGQVFWDAMLCRRLDGTGIESRCRRDFQHPSSCTVGTGFLSPSNGPGRGVDHLPPSSAEIKERLELYLSSASGPSWPVLGRTLPYFLPKLEFFRQILLKLLNIKFQENPSAGS